MSVNKPRMTAPDPHELDRLAALIQRDDQDAFIALIRATALPLRCFVATMAADGGQLEEIIQATYVTAFQRLSTYEPRGTMMPWLKGIARNLLLRDLRERKRHLQVDVSVIDEVLVDDSWERAQADDERQAARTQALDHLQRCMQALPRSAQDLLTCCYQDALSLNQLAQRFRRTRAAIAMQLSRLRASLRACVQRQIEHP